LQEKIKRQMTENGLEANLPETLTIPKSPRAIHDNVPPNVLHAEFEVNTLAKVGREMNGKFYEVEVPDQS
jgi:hypothetical protein